MKYSLADLGHAPSDVTCWWSGLAEFPALQEAREGWMVRTING